MLLLAWLGCAYTIGSGLTAGALDEVGGKGRSAGVEGVAEDLIERQLLMQLGHQLGQGLGSGVTEIDPEQQARLEQTIDDLITVAMQKAGHGLRHEVSPELREMVQKDIVRALSEGLRGELGDSLEATVDRVVARTVRSLRENLGDEQTQLAISDLLRDSMYYAVREDGVTPSVGETVRTTLSEDMLGPISSTVEDLTSLVEVKVNEQARRTENTLRGIIGFLVLLIGVVAILYFVSNRQARRAEERRQLAERTVANVDAALELLDEDHRKLVLEKLDEYRKVEARRLASKPPAPPQPKRSDDYVRRR